MLRLLGAEDAEAPGRLDALVREKLREFPEQIRDIRRDIKVRSPRGGGVVQGENPQRKNFWGLGRGNTHQHLPEKSRVWGGGGQSHQQLEENPAFRLTRNAEAKFLRIANCRGTFW